MDYFFIIGAQRCGTTYLYRALDQHPSVCMARPLRPEAKYFLGKSYGSDNLSEFEVLFAHSNGAEQLRGEKATTYIESEIVAQRILETFPTARILVMLRDPVERAISNYRFSVENGLETLDADSAFLNEETRSGVYDKARFSTSPFAYLQRGRYFGYLLPWLDRFGSDQLRPIVYENFIGDPAELKSVHEFLGLEPADADLHFTANASSSPIISLQDETRAYLMDYFAESKLRLASKFNLDLSVWD